MKTAIGIILVVVLAVGVWLSLRLGQTPMPPSTTATSTPEQPAPPQVSLPNTYRSASLGFSLRYPDGYSINERYQYTGFGPHQNIVGVGFTIPTTTPAGTNLASDTYLSVEVLPKGTCSANQFLDINSGTKARNIADNGVIYSFASSTGAAAGNRYEESVYALPGAQSCIAVRYFIHYGVLENYPPGKVVAFDRVALLAQFDAMRRSLSVQ
jgi:hypothetical protein